MCVEGQNKELRGASLWGETLGAVAVLGQPQGQPHKVETALSSGHCLPPFLCQACKPRGLPAAQHPQRRGKMGSRERQEIAKERTEISQMSSLEQNLVLVLCD